MFNTLDHLTSNGRLAVISLLQLSSWLHIFHRKTKVYLNCDKSICDGKVTSITQPDKNDYVI